MQIVKVVLFFLNRIYIGECCRVQRLVVRIPLIICLVHIGGQRIRAYLQVFVHKPASDEVDWVTICANPISQSVSTQRLEIPKQGWRQHSGRRRRRRPGVVGESYSVYSFFPFESIDTL